MYKFSLVHSNFFKNFSKRFLKHWIWIFENLKIENIFSLHFWKLLRIFTFNPLKYKLDSLKDAEVKNVINITVPKGDDVTQKNTLL